MIEQISESEKRRTFNRSFWSGFTVGSLVFLGANVVAYAIANQRHEEYLSRPIQFAPAPHFRFGFPFDWDGYNFGYFWDGTVNLLVWMLFAFMFGLTARYLVKR